MDQKKIRVTIDPLGKPKVEAIGFNGMGCAEATKGIEDALAGSSEATTRVMKPEWHATETEENHQTMSW